jgi:carbamate kinase
VARIVGRTAVVALGGNALVAGSMGPKVRAAVRFVERGDARVAVITTPRLGVNTLGNTDPADLSVGTRIIHVDSRQGALT